MFLFLQEKEPTDPTEKQDGWIPEPVWTIRRTEKSPVPESILYPLVVHPAFWSLYWRSCSLRCELIHGHPGGENCSGRTHYKDARRCRGWYSMKHGASGLTCSALHGCRYDIFITELDALVLRHVSATADYILCPLTSVCLALSVPTEQRCSGSLTTPRPRPPTFALRTPSGAAQLFTKRNLQVPWRS